MSNGKCCAKCLSAEDFNVELRRGEDNNLEWMRPTFAVLQKKIGWLRQAQFCKPDGIRLSIAEFQGLKELNIKNEVIEELVNIFRTKPDIREDVTSYLFLLLLPVLKKTGCHYCEAILPAYDPFAEAYYGAYNAVTKGKFKEGDIILPSIIRRVRAHLLNLAKKNGRWKPLMSGKTIEEIEKGLDAGDEDWE